jgi:adenylylsulfate kinase-like enzyme
MSKIIWFTGQPGSGKTTLANSLILKLNNRNISNIIHIDGDDLRDLTENKDYSEKGRRKNIKLAQRIALFCSNKGFYVIVSLVAPFKDLRDSFKNKNNVLEFYLQTTEERGREHFFSDDYEKPSENYSELDTGKNSISSCTDIILDQFLGKEV